MAEPVIGKKKETAKTPNLYYAMKSHHEVYYQMASIFKAATHDEDKLAKKIFTGVLAGNQPEIFMENSL
ncbi:MAG: hypothetical protein GXP56_13245 [Deltaproteobacteria bacterium]|nr:hypothetical protein [Deltaproteobacteria bacterium]